MTEVTEAVGSVQSTVEDGIGLITLDNPRKRNALSPAMWRRIPLILEQFSRDAGVLSVIISGSGATFSAGADIAGFGELKASDHRDAEIAIAEFGKPTIAAIEGPCIGGGCEIATPCDIRIASSESRFGIPPARIGIVYPGGAIARLSALVGPAVAKHLLFSAEVITAQRAYDIGFVQQIVEPGTALTTAKSLAAQYNRGSQLSIRVTKQIFRDIADGRHVATDDDAWHDFAVAGPDFAEGVSAFLERRSPSFTWNGDLPSSPAASDWGPRQDQ